MASPGSASGIGAASGKAVIRGYAAGTGAGAGKAAAQGHAAGTSAIVGTEISGNTWKIELILSPNHGIWVDSQYRFTTQTEARQFASAFPYKWRVVASSSIPHPG